MSAVINPDQGHEDLIPDSPPNYEATTGVTSHLGTLQKWHCPPQGPLGQTITGLMLILSLYVAIISVLGGGPSVLPSTNCTYYQPEGAANLKRTTSTLKCDGGLFFSLYVIFIASMLAGQVVPLVRMPPLLGMLLIGALLRNVPILHRVLLGGLDTTWSAFLRQAALCIILLRAGLGLNPETLWRLSAVVFRLAFTPCSVEAACAAVMARLLLGLPWLWAFMLGFVLAAVSPAVVVPSVLGLQLQGYGVTKGVPTLLIAAASVDDVLAITGFGVVMSMAFSTSSVWMAVLRGPLEALVGIVFGVVVGLVLWFVPQKDTERFLLYRFVLLLCAGVVALFGSGVLHLSGAGPLGCLTVAFVAGIGWRRMDGWDDESNPLLSPLETVWWLAQPFLFGLIGAEVDLAALNPTSMGKGLACVAVSLLFRVVASFLAVLGAGLNVKERIFVAVAWLPKATVQAAIGPVAYDMAVRQTDAPPEYREYGLQILTLAVLSIILTAPLGAALVALTGPRLLERRPSYAEVALEGSDKTATHDTDGQPDALKRC